jgi:hypothetical protein
MSIARLLIDNDILMLMAGANLLERTVSVLGFDLVDSARLETLPYILQRSRKLRHLPVDVKEKIAQGCKRVPTLHDAPNSDLLQQLTDVADIDAGEAVLYALLAQHPLCLLTSGDKRAMRAVATAAPLHGVRRSVAGRVVCLETVLLELVKQDGVSTIAQALSSARSQNTLLRVAFSPGCIANPAECMNALSRYYQKLVDDVGEDFLWKGA